MTWRRMRRTRSMRSSPGCWERAGWHGSHPSWHTETTSGTRWGSGQLSAGGHVMRLVNGTIIVQYIAVKALYSPYISTIRTTYWSIRSHTRIRIFKLRSHAILAIIARWLQVIIARINCHGNQLIILVNWYVWFPKPCQYLMILWHYLCQ